ncbi:hypothetical protein TNCV_2488331 [Trichonephila clavipes]|nr:hypothetical protein TNCV_2488331 [Trichonephila clavipes]
MASSRPYFIPTPLAPADNQGETHPRGTALKRLLQFLKDMYVEFQSECLRFIASNETIRSNADLEPNNLDQMQGNAYVDPKDEVQTFRAGRYVCRNEAAWRILGHPLHESPATVTFLAVHLPNVERI